MIDVISSTFSSTGLTYPEELNRIWRVFLLKKFPYTYHPVTPVLHYFIQQNTKHNPICLTYDPVIGSTSTDSRFPIGNTAEPYNFAVPAKIVKDAVMFIGMNPSYIPSIEKTKKGTIPYDDYWKLSPKVPDNKTGWQFEEFYDQNSIFYKIPYFKDLRKLMMDIYEYKLGQCDIKKEDEISTRIGEKGIVFCNDSLKFSHLDLLAIRHTTQGDIEDALLQYYKPKTIFKEFIDCQIDIFKDLLEKSNPKVIIVNNAFVSKIFRNDNFYFQNNTLSQSDDDFQELRRHLNMPLRWDRNNETYMWYNPKAQKEIPVFLLGMTTGGSFDLGSRERLIAQVAKFI